MGEVRVATVEAPRWGVKVKYKNGIETTMWRATEEARDRLHRELNRDKSVHTAKAVER